MVVALVVVVMIVDVVDNWLVIEMGIVAVIRIEKWPLNFVVNNFVFAADNDFDIDVKVNKPVIVVVDNNYLTVVVVVEMDFCDYFDCNYDW